eukprot:CAMPEP_0113702172 /NCGR_PEP_ID=MMETSP0038_2-20120614/25027_1 /TAXON_ID=2898 /ORGANISM="Cryptomonas paramecium" /LENGTH=400 /DNA_ID=CAMNT_0000626235 /DNA_START=61 /DNA_END=1260 /DNA_ORIENTATION=+ /assembly_acc=CAM_ASM_000170
MADVDKSRKETAGIPTVEDQLNAIGTGRFHYLLVLMVSLLAMGDGMEIIVVTLISSELRSQWNVSKIEVGGLASAIFVGVLVGSLFGGILADKFGRKVTVMMAGSIFIIGGISSAFAQSLVWLCVLRALLGIGLGTYLPPIICLFAELIPTNRRAFYQIVLTGLAWAVGEILVCVFALVLRKYYDGQEWWRVLLLVCATPSMLGMILFFIFSPESPHFLLTQGRDKEAEALSIAEDNGKSDKLLCGGKVCHVASDEGDEWSWFQLFSKDLFFITLAVCITWSICSFTYYGHTYIYPLILEERYNMPFEDQYWAVMLAAAAEIPSVFIAVALVGIPELGRRLSMAALFGISAVIALTVPFFDDSVQFLVINMVLKGGINAAFCVQGLFAVEIFPTTHRASG